jgi:hypothetical protein
MNKKKIATLLVKVGKMIDTPPSFWDLYQPKSPNMQKNNTEK